jgi:hypothetical protein
MLTAAETHVTPLVANDAHDLWLTTWAECGLVGLGLLAWYHAMLARALWARRSRSWLGRGGVLAFAAYHLLALVHHLPFHSSVSLAFALVWGAALSESTANPPESRPIVASREVAS